MYSFLELTRKGPEKSRYLPRLKHFQINQHIICHLSKAYSFGDLSLDQQGNGPSINVLQICYIGNWRINNLHFWYQESFNKGLCPVGAILLAPSLYQTNTIKIQWRNFPNFIPLARTCDPNMEKRHMMVYGVHEMQNETVITKSINVA